MAIELNHTIVHAHDREDSAHFLADLFGLQVGAPWGPFLPVQVSGVTLDYATVGPDEQVTTQHYAFLVSEFDQIWGRIKDQGITYYPEPFMRTENEINTNDGGRGLYFLDPNGHGMEIITVPYGGWAAAD
jgi:catechol 2,3-dioxygenase-like lactoylglutathione lyase family enzyme